MSEHIRVSISNNGIEKDYKIPSQVTPRRLEEMYSEICVDKQILLPEKWHFEVKGKVIDLDSDYLISELGLSDGDVLKVVAEK